MTAGRDAALISALIDAMPEPVLVIAGSLRLSAANTPARALFPYLRLDAPLASSLRAVDLHDAVARVLAGGPAEDISWLARAPVERLYQARVAAFDSGEARHVAVTLHDATESRRLEQMRVDFVANASHELRTPLASLLGFIETLIGPARDDSAAREKFLGIMLHQARRMARLVDDLLSLSRIEQTLHVQPRAAVDLAAVVEQVRDALSPLAKDNRIELVVEARKILVRGDRDELLRVAENLIENAIKYSAPEPGQADRKVWISIESHDGVGILSVRDEGPGIAPENIPRLTERFYRVDVGQSRAKGGTGLGLALVKHILARHRGRLSIQSLPGEGATFSAHAPLFE
ncbi:two-component system, OmpR family, phosphate regulon sensor histidine kinase PhoR [Rhodoblastus acidophilus]|uniref:histidine kinase n=1 Tax=Rhodoblastus acidophilus TaxID=1074 RepID=A0A212S5H2_RHOAC|nr:ATP-binding protein [Rhodoblastus acidophilus]MCW2318447.1 two-component system phosphate regulon sensor histidine kinase PhoR [Rhodoblastus acidophilus]PPQ37508.1 two-component sensor histidine kinase [Rhodoblastus acidophilus]RAI19674.1 two-component sensor histidine kinase [Rhodoblastus acidophilus]SNB80470.1 two-component system, OmpR family, phosphate regulon sensor histidine kinase PhoR [Rhodoblastus acidophilus]